MKIPPVIKYAAAIFIIFQSYVFGQVNDCTGKKSCGECISSGPLCSWCRDEVYKQSDQVFHERCNFLSKHLANGCKSVSNPSSNNTIDVGRKLQGETRVSPQNVTVNLRPGRPTTVKINVKTPTDFPVDLYYLMDLSASMEDDLEQIKRLGQLLGKEMKKVTSNFRLGFGAFVDKPVAPYTETNPGEVKKRLVVEKRQYTFGFRNYLPLDEDPRSFENVVNKLRVSFSIDEPEGSLDALMQATVCENAIGWRDKRKARRIIILTTDATFHYAGDGILGGAVKPNDGRCHLENGNYTASKLMDYPSLSFVKQVMIDNEIVPIFATTNHTKLYKRVADFFGSESAAVADTLEKDSSNVVPLIRQAYEKIAKFVSISVEPLEDLDVKITAICGKNKAVENAKSCNDVELGEEIEFKVQLTAKSCSPKLLSKDSFLIKTSFDNVFVKLNLVCNCECEHRDHQIRNSSLCSSRGDLVCGKCECVKPYAGRMCQCDAQSVFNDSLCRRPGKEGEPVCSNVGRCECGECNCFPSKNKNAIIYGVDCECSNASCKRSFGEICGGPTRGVCECNKCACLPDWTGEACGDECLNSTVGCFRDGIECSGQGICSCGKCQCFGQYIGKYCDQCISNCPDPCDDYKECVRCKVFQTGNLKGAACTEECKNRNVTEINKVDYVKSAGDDRCVVGDDDDCSFVYTYRVHNVTKNVDLFVQKERICPAEPDILAIILGVIAGIVGIGLALLLIWKLLATIQDRREFAKFEKDRENARWQTGENPIFKQATSTFQNPLYGGQS